MSSCTASLDLLSRQLMALVALAMRDLSLLLVRLRGVRLVVEWNGDAAAIDVRPSHCRFCRAWVLRQARALGYEAMSEDECPSEERADGFHRVWLAQAA